MKKNLSKFLIFGLFLFVALGCGVFNKIKKEIEIAGEPQTLISTDGKSQITVPGNWKKQTDLHNDATLQAANLMGELYIIVIPESKQGLGKSIDLDYATKAVRESLNGTVSGLVLSEPVPTTINGLPARQFEASGEVEKLKVTYLYAIVDAPQSFYQVITWTLTPRFQSSKGKLQEVINSFKETGSNNEPPPPAPKRK